MATKPLCSIPDCIKPVRNAGFCKSHHYRWKTYGDPLGGRIIRGTASKEIERALACSTPEMCWTWPYSTAQGRGVVRICGVLKSVARLVCEAAHGPPPGDEHQALHGCGNGHLGCINPHHLRWGTQVENMADAVLHGTAARGERQGGAKLTEADVIAIRQRYAEGGVLQRELAAEYGITRENARDIINGRRWGWMDTFTAPPRTNKTRSKAKSAFGRVAVK